MKFYLVTQSPKRSGYVTAVVFVIAKSGADAIRVAAEQHPDHIGLDQKESFYKPQARELLEVTGESFDYKLAPLTAFHFN